ncbi:hypothetical protein [Streptomyces dengpaensis]|uniref:hypothetical protein n=1 Tax=Streptomyces dengpaensis TaxID=2049881 RepID=UPI001F0B90AA|nr:hypothetical protein [Streptomyces dengpaensis]
MTQPALSNGVARLEGELGDLVARAFDAARTLERPRGLVLREADFDPLRRDLEAGRLAICSCPPCPPSATVLSPVNWWS